jgi:large subunit ribosomal protein L19
VLRHGQVRRAKLFYLREKVGRHARIRERRQPIGGPEMTLLRAEPDALTEAEVEPDELLDEPDEPEIADTETAAVTAEADDAEGAAAPSESDGGA